MKKKTKKIFGFVGLALVIGVTAIACSLPSPKAKATQSVVDNIQVRVVGSAPDVRFTDTENNEIIIYPRKTFSVEYEKVVNYGLTLTHTDMDGNVTSEVIDTRVVNNATGKNDYTIIFNGGEI